MVIKFEDRIKREVNVGDTVILVARESRDLFVVKILGFSANFHLVKLEHMSTEHKDLKGQQIWRKIIALTFVDFVKEK